MALVLMALQSSRRLKSADIESYQGMLFEVADAGRKSRSPKRNKLSNPALGALDAGLRSHEKRLRRRHGVEPPSLLGPKLKNVRVGLAGFSAAR